MKYLKKISFSLSGSTPKAAVSASVHTPIAGCFSFTGDLPSEIGAPPLFPGSPLGSLMLFLLRPMLFQAFRFPGALSSPVSVATRSMELLRLESLIFSTTLLDSLPRSPAQPKPSPAPPDPLALFHLG